MSRNRSQSLVWVLLFHAQFAVACGGGEAICINPCTKSMRAMVSHGRTASTLRTEKVRFHIFVHTTIILTSACTVLEEDSGDSQETLNAGSNTDSQGNPDRFQTVVNGRRVNVKRVPTSEANQVLGLDHNQESHTHEHHDGQTRAPVNEHGLGYADRSGQQQHFGLQDGLPPLQERATNETSQTKEEEKETQRREEEEERDFYNQYRNPIARFRAKYPQAPAEFLAVCLPSHQTKICSADTSQTFIYLLIGLCVNLSVATSQQGTGSFETQAWGWGFAAMIGIYLGGGVSGSHLSPTVSISLSVFRGFPWKMAIVYICMQLLAGLAAGAVAYA